MNEYLNKWFKEKWVNIGKKVDGKHPPCGTSGDKSGYAKCVPAAKAAGMSKKEKESATRRKRDAQNDAGRAEAMKGYNDDLIMALGIGLWVRNTALRLRQEGIDLTKNMLNSTTVNHYQGVISTGYLKQNPYEMELGRGETENLTWLLR